MCSPPEMQDLPKFLHNRGRLPPTPLGHSPQPLPAHLSPRRARTLLQAHLPPQAPPRRPLQKQPQPSTRPNPQPPNPPPPQPSTGDRSEAFGPTAHPNPLPPVRSPTTSPLPGDRPEGPCPQLTRTLDGDRPQKAAFPPPVLDRQARLPELATRVHPRHRHHAGDRSRSNSNPPPTRTPTTDPARHKPLPGDRPEVPGPRRRPPPGLPSHPELSPAMARHNPRPQQPRPKFAAPDCRTPSPAELRPGGLFANKAGSGMAIGFVHPDDTLLLRPAEGVDLRKCPPPRSGGRRSPVASNRQTSLGVVWCEVDGSAPSS
ncbi:hypothetical protein C8E87_5951 [Paractinoplanes brasiliensis]|uniref:Uncharacterized protein n=1 Tax=Paractinoplanes brasiliensis TaxID=52695 RepID=A0A4R6K4H6_9ACTN|nr:hypothetical protein C8E87_5951 [Actinoplanes brasiliensis]